MPQLIGDYSYEVLSAEAFRPLFAEYRPVVFAGTSSFNPRDHYSDAEVTALDALRSNVAGAYRLHVGIFYRDQFVGWHFGQQLELDRFYMTNTGLLEEHRRRGLYTALLPVVLDQLRQKGFQIVFSRHNLTNNAVIIPKLKAGFVISGFEVDDRFGTLVQLSYYFNPLRRKVLDVRVGQSRPDDETRDLL